MDAAQIISNAIDGLLDPSVKLKDVLLKLKAVAYLIENSDLQNWVEAELNGYYGDDIVVPEYRRVGCIPRGNLTTVRGNAWQKDQILSTEYVSEELHDALGHRYLNQSVAELEHLLAKSDEGQGLSIPIPHNIHRSITSAVYAKGGWHIHSAWQAFSPTSIEGVLTGIRSKILDLLMPLKVAFKDNIPLQSLQQKQTVNDKVNKVLHSINIASGSIVNMANGDSAVQVTNTGLGSVNVATGNNINQFISAEQSTSLQNLIAQIKQAINAEPSFDDQREAMDDELNRVDAQLKRDEPKKSIIKRSFESLRDLAAGAAGKTAGYTAFELIKQGIELVANNAS